MYVKSDIDDDCYECEYFYLCGERISTNAFTDCECDKDWACPDVECDDDCESCDVRFGCENCHD
jgi:hypothetical protein